MQLWVLSATAGSREEQRHKTLCFDSLEVMLGYLKSSGELLIFIKLFSLRSGLGVLGVV